MPPALPVADPMLYVYIKTNDLYKYAYYIRWNKHSIRWNSS